MLILVSGASKSMAAFAGHERLGVLFDPGGRNRPSHSLRGHARWAVDNGAYSGFDANLFVRLLERVRDVPGCLFVAAPDVVGDAEETLRLFRLWEPMIRALGFPVALVGQDGLDLGRVPWDRLEAVFLGGTSEWKHSREAITLAGMAKARGKWVHMGRVNIRSRMHFAERIGCDSVDGSAFSKWSATFIPKGLRWTEPLPLFQGER